MTESEDKIRDPSSDLISHEQMTLLACSKNPKKKKKTVLKHAIMGRFFILKKTCLKKTRLKKDVSFTYDTWKWTIFWRTGFLTSWFIKIGFKGHP